MKFSICIPTWEQYGRGLEFLKNNLEKISQQEYKNFEVIISDHSKDDVIQNLCEQYKEIFDLKYFRYTENFGNGPANTNNAITKASGDIIKIIFQDDFFYQTTALDKILIEFEKGSKWVVNGCNHTYDDGISFSNFMIPHWNEKIPLGVNTISSPSVLSFVNQELCFFDENLVMLMDCEFYYQLYKKYGLPTIISNVLITNRMHKHQISNTYTGKMNDEIIYVKNKHKII